MDVVPDRELHDFIDSLDVKEDQTTIEDRSTVGDDTGTDAVATSADGADAAVETSSVWQNIADALDNWSQRILDAETLHDRSENLRLAIESSLYRQSLDGFLTSFELAELLYIADRWIRLLHAISSYSVGYTYVKEDIISLMLDLYDLKQLNAHTFIDCCAKL